MRKIYNTIMQVLRDIKNGDNITTTEQNNQKIFRHYSSTPRFKLGQPKLINTAEDFRRKMKSLNSEQTIILHDLIYRIKQGNLPYYLFLEGPGGNGKNYLIELLVGYATQIWSIY